MSSPATLLVRLSGCPEPSGSEQQTAAAVGDWLADRGLHVERGIAGTGLLVQTSTVRDRDRDGATGHGGRGHGGTGNGATGNGGTGDGVDLWRAELDAVPARDGIGHHCGHDGHMAMLCGGLARMEEAGRPVAALFQPAEETGAGMAQCLQDPRLDRLPVRRAFAIHNLPGEPLGAVVLSPGAMASVGARYTLRGRSSHAAEPHEGRSPWPEAVRLAEAVRQRQEGDPRATLVHVRLGSEAYGTSPGTAVVAATVRGSRTEEVARLAEGFAAAIGPTTGPPTGPAPGLADEPLDIGWEAVDPFPATRNDPAALGVARNAARQAGLRVVERDAPWPWSEDFGHAIERWPGALIGLGAGIDQPPLHDAAYTFPTGLLEQGIAFWAALGGAG